MVVSAKNLNKRYSSGTEAIRGISFDIKKGEIYGFLGPNGAGKSTLIKMISCYFPATSGELSVLGLDPNKKASKIKRCLGIMPQDNNLDPDLTVFENLYLYANYFSVPRKKRLERIDELLKLVGLEHKRNARVTQISGGQQRRVVLARSIINEPKILILDEPSAGLDPHSRQVVWSIVRDLNAKGCTVILTTHYMKEAEELCHRIAFVDAGKIVALDTPEGHLAANNATDLEDVYLKTMGSSLEE